MRIHIPYGGDAVTISIEGQCQVLNPQGRGAEEPLTRLSDALAGPVGTEPLEEHLEGADGVLVLVTDATRPTPTNAVLAAIGDGLLAHPNLEFLVATGTHRQPTEDEFAVIFGRFYDRIKNRVKVHDSSAAEKCFECGRTSRGTVVRFNGEIIESDLLLTINNVKPHYFAGFTGGRKIFLPGTAAYETIEANHSLACSQDAMPMRLEGNPVSEDMGEAATMVKTPVFSIQTVVTPGHKLYSVAAGSLADSFMAGTEAARNLYSAPLKERGNIVVTANPHPMDINLYQAQHAIENGRLALEDGGILILVSKCWDGVGNDSLLEAFDRVRTYEDVERELESGYKLGYHKVSRVMKMLESVRIWAVTDLEPEVIKRAKMRPFADIGAAVDTAFDTIKAEGGKPRPVFMPSGGVTVPTIS
jgi:nickel-dependent lactate racemase